MSPNVVIRGNSDAGGGELCYFTLSFLEDISTFNGLASEVSVSIFSG